MPDTPTFRTYQPADRDACLALFDLNSPTYFAPNEREDFADFLEGQPRGYEVVELGDRTAGAYGLADESTGVGRLTWIMVDPTAQGSGVGSAMMRRVAARARESGLARIEIAASQHSESFFVRFGAETHSVTPDGWGPGMHRHDMSMRL